MTRKFITNSKAAKKYWSFAGEKGTVWFNFYIFIYELVTVVLSRYTKHVHSPCSKVLPVFSHLSFLTRETLGVWNSTLCVILCVCVFSFQILKYLLYFFQNFVWQLSLWRTLNFVHFQFQSVSYNNMADPRNYGAKWHWYHLLSRHKMLLRAVTYLRE